MIELRWASRIGANPRAGPYTVLEYRVDLSAGLGKSWTDWMRVPTVYIPRNEDKQCGDGGRE